MVPGPRAAPGPGALQPLDQPRPAAVRLAEDGTPGAVQVRGRWEAVEAVTETWRIDEGWWRPDPVSRLYSTLALEDGGCLTLFRDLLADRWYSQSSGARP